MSAQPDHNQTPPAMLEVREMYVGYYKDLHILQGVNLIARQAKITAVLGANGVGKSTLLRAIYGFLPPASGEVLLDGKSSERYPDPPTYLHGPVVRYAAAQRLCLDECGGEPGTWGMDFPRG